MFRHRVVAFVPALASLSFVACATAMETPRVSDDDDDGGGADGRVDAGPASSDARTTTPTADAASGAPTVDAAAADAAPQGSSCAQATTGVLATWSFAGATGSQTSTATASSAAGITASPISRTGVTATSGSGSINASNWPTAAQRDLGKYYTFSVTPPAGCTLTLTSVAIDGRASGTGPTQASVATSADAFAATAAVSTTAASTPSLTVTAATGPIEIRIYGFAASSTGGTFRLQNTLTLSGSLQ